MPEETQLIQPVEVARDADGMFNHAGLPDFEEDGTKWKEWFAEQGLSYTLVFLEHDASDEVRNIYYDRGEPDCREWTPSKPDGDGWFCLSIHDTNDGPVCWWARREITP
jgi:hypothetical protein